MTNTQNDNYMYNEEMKWNQASQMYVYICA